MGQEGHLEVYLQGPYQTVVAALGLSRGEELSQRPNTLPLRKLRQPLNVADNGQHITQQHEGELNRDMTAVTGMSADKATPVKGVKGEGTQRDTQVVAVTRVEKGAALTQAPK